MNVIYGDSWQNMDLYNDLLEYISFNLSLAKIAINFDHVKMLNVSLEYFDVLFHDLQIHCFLIKSYFYHILTNVSLILYTINCSYISMLSTWPLYYMKRGGGGSL